VSKIEQYFEVKRSTWSPTTLASERSRYSKLLSFGFPDVDPITLLNKVKQHYKRYSVKQLFIRAAAIEEQVFGTTRYKQFMHQHKEAFRGSYIGKTFSLSDQQVRDILVIANTLQPAQNNFIVVCVYGGLRKQEALRLLWEHIDGEKLLVKGGKGARDRLLPFPSATQRSLATTRTPAVCKGCNVAKTVSYICDTTKVKFTPHDLRSYCLTRYSQTLTPFELQKFAGHSSVKTTERYVRVNADRVLEKLTNMEML